MKVKKNICITINALELGGAEKQSVLLAKALKAHHNVTLVVVDPTKEVYPARLQTLEQEDIKPIFLPKNFLLKIVVLTKLLRKKKIEFIFSFLATDMVLGALCGKIVGVPYLFGGIRSSSWPRFKFMALRATHNYLLNYTISNNYAGRRVAVDFGFNENVFVIPNGIEIRPLKPIKGHSKTITIISLGRLVSLKRYDIAIQTIAHLKTIIDEYYAIRYKIVGQGPEEEAILETIEKFEVREEIEVVTNVSDMYMLLEHSDIYLSTSSFEGISNALMEAMNCALPIVATDVGDNSYLVENEQNGFLVEVNDYKAMAEKLKELIEKPNRRHQMGIASYDRLAQNFSFETFQQKYLNIISKVERIKIRDGEVYFESETEPGFL